MEFNIYGECIEITDGQLNFALLKMEFVEIKNKYLNDFCEEYKKTIKGPQDTTTNTEIIIDKVGDLLAKYQVEALTSIYSKLCAAREYDEITLEYLSDEYKSNDPFDAIEDLHKQVKKLALFYRDKKVRDSFGNVFEECMWTMFKSVMRCIGDFYQLDFKGHLDDCEKNPIVISGIDTLENKYITLENKKLSIREMLTAEPGYIEMYKYAIENFGDAESGIEALGYTLGIDVEKMKRETFRSKCSAKKAELDEAHKHEIDIRFSTKEDGLKALKQEIVVINKDLGFIDEEKGKTLLENEINEIDIELDKVIKATRCVDGVLYDTLEEANEAKEDLRLLIDFIKENDVNEESLKDKIMALQFKTDIVKGNIDEKVKQLKEMVNPNTVSSRTKKAIEEECLFENSPIDSEIIFKYILIHGQAANYQSAKDEFTSFINLKEDEIISFIFKAKALVGSKCSWLVVTNYNVYAMNSSKKGIQEYFIIPYNEVRNIEITDEGNIRVSRKNGDIHNIKTAMLVAGALMTGYELLGNGLTKCLDVLAAFPHQSSTETNNIVSSNIQSEAQEVQQANNINNNLGQQLSNTINRENESKKGGIKSCLIIMLITFVVTFLLLMLIGFFC